jgi:hypothetical protein
MRRREAQQQPSLLTEHGHFAAADYVRLVALGFVLREPLLHQAARIGTMKINFDERILFLEGFFEWAHRLVDDQRRVPHQFTFLFGAFFENLLPIGPVEQCELLRGQCVS